MSIIGGGFMFAINPTDMIILIYKNEKCTSLFAPRGIQVVYSVLFSFFLQPQADVCRPPIKIVMLKEDSIKNLISEKINIWFGKVIIIWPCQLLNLDPKFLHIF